MADLIGDSDPIKAANLKLDYSDERVIHFGLVPRSHQGIFVINELCPTCSPIQVALFNIPQEGDVRSSGFKLRLPTSSSCSPPTRRTTPNRAPSSPPLKDRIQSKVLTHPRAPSSWACASPEQEPRSLRSS